MFGRISSLREQCESPHVSPHSEPVPSLHSICLPTSGSVRSARTWSLLRNSLLLALLTTVVAGAVGAILGVILAKTDLALRNTLAAVSLRSSGRR
jgi:hypothetical protein